MKLYEELIKEIQDTYESGVTIEHAEKLAAKFLHAMIQVSQDLQNADLNRRMRKRGLKAIKSAVRLEEIKKHDKKPTEGALEDIVNMSELVSGEEESFDEAEVNKELLENYLMAFKEAHVFYRGVSKGRYE